MSASAAAMKSFVANGMPVLLGTVDLIPLGEGREFRIGDLRVAVFRTRQGEVLATQAKCPHRGGPLADGILGDCKIICPFHGFGFDLRTGAARGNDCASLRTYRIEVGHDGALLLHLGPP